MFTLSIHFAAAACEKPDTFSFRHANDLRSTCLVQNSNRASEEWKWNTRERRLDGRVGDLIEG